MNFKLKTLCWIHVLLLHPMQLELLLIARFIFSSGASILQPNKILSIPLIIYLQHFIKAIHQCCEEIIGERLHRDIFLHCSCDCNVGNEILILLDNPTTLDDSGNGPYPIILGSSQGMIILLNKL